MSPSTWDCESCSCDPDGRGHSKFKIPGVLESTNKCLRKMVTPYSWYLLDLHKHYEQGNLALAGGVTDQPAVYLDAMALITEWKSRGSSDS